MFEKIAYGSRVGQPTAKLIVNVFDINNDGRVSIVPWLLACSSTAL